MSVKLKIKQFPQQAENYTLLKSSAVLAKKKILINAKFQLKVESEYKHRTIKVNKKAGILIDSPKG